MMTSVTLSSSSGTIHGGYSSVTGEETVTVSNSESDYDGRCTTTSSSTATPSSAATAAVPVPLKRCLGILPSADTCKKRRKQSTPIRISAAEIEDTTTTIPASATVTNCEGKPSSALAAINSPENDIERRCPVCQQYFDNSDQLENHLQSEHGRIIECKKEELTPNSTPTHEQQHQQHNIDERSETPLELTVPRNNDWLNDLQNKEWKNHGSSSISFNPIQTNPMFMTLPQFVQSSDSLQRQPIRIFNPDAYCDLCNKEFCNKYFLKTHKANKHGIYTDTPLTDTVQAATTATTCVNIPSFTGNLKPPPSTTTTITTTVPSVEIPFIKNETNKIQLNPFSDNLTYSNVFTNNKTTTTTTTTTKILKQTVPGVGCVAATTTTQFIDNSENDNQNSNGFTTYTTTTCNSVGDNNDLNVKKMSEDHIVADESSSPNNIIIPPTESTSFKSDLDGVYYEQSKMSPGQQQQQQNRELDLSNRLRKIGVMNPKAFCEICCKEYCNKYFLRTHKMKRHGIYIPDDKDKDIKFDTSFGHFSWQHHTMQTSPLNLIMGEQSSSERKTTSPNDISCEICGIKFQNASLAQLHNISVHEKIPTKQLNEQFNTNNQCGDDNNRKSPDDNIVEAISADLQKLQSMILQLNDLDANKMNRSCNSCNKEFENRYYLHAHMLTEHGVLLDEPNEMNKQQCESETNSNNNTMQCELNNSKDGQNGGSGGGGGGGVSDEITKNHLIEFQHQQQQQQQQSRERLLNEEQNTKDDFNENFNQTRTPTTTNTGQITERRISLNVTPTSSYCDICNKELCNKYFMKTHMQRMHGIEIENGAQIGGVVCDICNKELCSKYFLRVHKHNTHGIIDCPSSLLQPRKSDGEQPPTLPPPPPPPPPPSSQQQQQSILLSEPDSSLKPDKDDTDNRYFSHYTEVCTICSRRFKSTKWLKAHLLSDHGQTGQDKWTELELQIKNDNKTTNDNTMIKLERFSPTLKIPNGGCSNNNNISGGGGGGGGGCGGTSSHGIQNVLSSLFGVDETNAKTYQCSYCSFTTTLLPLLFVHERSHTINSNGELTQLKCPVCPQSFLQPELLQHHLFTQHPYLPLPPFFNGNNNQLHNDLSNDHQQQTTENDDETSCEQQKTKNKNKTTTKTKLKRTFELETQCFGGQSLKDVAKRAQLPATYALPQLNQNLIEDQPQQQGGKTTQGQNNHDDLSSGATTSSGYVMQAFLLEESAPERRVVPAVVFLPVVQKQPAPLTLTFTLTPA